MTYMLQFPGSIPVITLRGPRDPSLKNPQLAKLHLEVLFDDIEEPVDDLLLPRASMPSPYWMPGRSAAPQGAKVVILHCEAGISRSTAAALGIHFLGTSNPNTGVATAARELFAVNQFGHPNKLVGEPCSRPDGPEQARVISAQLIAAYSALQSVQENENRIRCD